MNRPRAPRFAPVLFVLAASAALVITAGPALPATQQAGSADAPLLDALVWRSVGPPGAGGRIVDLEVIGAFPHTIFVGAATGGLWRTTNNGVTFEPLFDDQNSNSIGAVAIQPTNPDVIWVGTGENNARNSVSWGDGVYKSTDGGSSWTNVGLRDSHHIGDILIDPTDPQTVYVAALGHFWGANEERGVYKTVDGGQNWQRVLFIDEETGVVDLAMDPRDPDTLYAAAYEVRRDGFSGGDPGKMYGPGSGIYKTTDGGNNWRELTRGLPRSEKGRIGLATTPADPAVVYAIVQTATTVGGPRDPDVPPDPEPDSDPTIEDGGVFRSDDRGETWQWVNPINPRPFYYSQIRADPSDADRVYVLGSSLARSDDGGDSFETLRINVHVDHHDLWIDPADPDHLILGNDGGLYMSYDRGASWDFLDQIALGQFYAIDVDMQDPYHIYGGVQDYMSWGGPSATRNQIGITNTDWYKVMTGDGFQVRVDPTDTNVIYAESQGGGIIRHDRRTGQNTRIQPEAPAGDERYRFNWETPIHISYHDPATLYMGGNMLFRSPDRGNSWEPISPDLTTHTVSDPEIRDGEPRKIGSMSAFAESPIAPGLLYAGTDDGNVWVTRDGGDNWIDLTEHFPGLDGKRWVSRLVASRFAADRAYAAFDGHRNDDFAPHLYVTLDAGETWESIAATLPDDHPVRVIREDVGNENLLFAGTEFGAFVSLDRGARWMPLDNGLPTVAVADLVVHPRDGDLIAGTHGRSAYVMDITPLQQLTDQVAAVDLHLFDIEDAVAFRYRVYSDDQFLGEKRWVADNPPYGATISYLVGADTEDDPADGDEAQANDAGGQDRARAPDAAIRIVDADGSIIRELSGPGTPGLHRISWDLRHGPLETDGGDGGGGGRGGRGGRGGGGRAPLAEPGTYQVTLDLDGRIETGTLTVASDPELAVTSEQRQARWATIERVRPLLLELSNTSRGLAELEAALEDLQEEMEGVDAFDEPLQEMLTSLLNDTRMLAFRHGRSAGGANSAYGAIESSPFPPTETQLRQIDEAAAAHPEHAETYRELVDERVPTLEAQMNAQGIPRVVIGR